MLEKIKKRKLLITVWTIALITMVGFGLYFISQSKSKETPPQTATVTKTTLTKIVSASGQVASSGQISITTQASGKVSKIHAPVGSTVKKGDKVLEIEPDQATIQNQKNTWTSYLSAKNALSQAKARIYTLEAAAIAAQQKFNHDVTEKNLASNDLTYQELQKALQAAQTELANQQSVISQAQSAADGAYTAYQNTATTVLALADGVIQDFAYEEGSYIIGSASGAAGSSTSVATLKVSDRLTVKVNVSELDISGIAIDQKVDLTLTALSGQIYHGKVISVASTGSTESNITTFPVVIEMTDATPQIRVGMAVSGDITIQTKENVLAVPNQAITTNDDKHTVTVMTQDGQQKQVSVSVGLILDTQSEITAGLSEGDKVILSAAVSEDETDSTNPETTGSKPKKDGP